jgi:hypothetical protein
LILRKTCAPLTRHAGQRCLRETAASGYFTSGYFIRCKGHLTEYQTRERGAGCPGSSE